jgi:O-antigen ligase
LPLSSICGAILVATPWLWPLTAGPSPGTIPLLVSAVAAAGLLLVLGRGADTGVVACVGWSLAALITSAIGLIQFFGFSHEFAPWVNAAGPGEAFGNLRQKNQFASLMSIGLLALLCAPSTGAGALRARAAGCMLIAVGSAMSLSRTGLLQLLLIVSLVMVWPSEYTRMRVRLATLTLGAYAFSAWGLPLTPWVARGSGAGGIADRLTADLGCSSRTVLWSNVFELITQRPWLGWGWRELDYAHYAASYTGQRFCDILDNAHNLPFHIAVELGVPLAFIVCVGCVWSVLRARPWKEADPTRQLAWGVLLIVCVHSLLEYPLWYGPFQMAVALCIALLRPTGHARASGHAKNRRGVLVGRTSISIFLLVGCSYVAWDYFRVTQLYLPPEGRAEYYREDTIAKVSDTWLFRNQVEFAELTLTPITHENALKQNAIALRLLHYSPEPRVIEKVIESAELLGRSEEVLWHQARFRAAFSTEFLKWQKDQVALRGAGGLAR